MVDSPSKKTPQLGPPVVPRPQRAPSDTWPALWWIGCHGGAGATTLARLTDLGADAHAAWPTPPPDDSARVVLVCRVSATGTRAATVAVEQWKRRLVPPRTELLGVVAVAASSRRPPRRAAERLQLVSGWVPATWRVGWVEEFLAADDARDVGVPPDVAALRHALSRALVSK